MLPLIPMTIALAKATETAVIWYIGEGFVGGVVAASGAYFFWPKGTKTPADDIKIAKINAEMVEGLEKPSRDAKTVLEMISEGYESISTLRNALYIQTDATINKMDQVITHAFDTAAQVNHSSQLGQSISNNAEQNVESMNTELHALRTALAAATNELQRTQRALTEKEAQLGETSDKLTTTEEQLSATLLEVSQKLKQMVNPQLAPLAITTLENTIADKDALLLESQAENKKLLDRNHALQQRLEKLISAIGAQDCPEDVKGARRAPSPTMWK